MTPAQRPAHAVQLVADVHRGVADALDEGYSPPEKPSVLLREGEHDTMDARLNEEIPEPDPYAEPEQEDNLTVRARSGYGGGAPASDFENFAVSTTAPSGPATVR